MLKLKKILNTCIAVGVMSVCFSLPMNVQGASILNECTENLENSVEDTQYSMLRGNILNYGNVKLSQLSSNSISIYGLTQCHIKSDDVYLSLYLERKVGGSYGTYKSWDYTKNDATSLSKSLIVSVPSGYYYRVRAYHAAADNGSSRESVTTLTNGVYVG